MFYKKIDNDINHMMRNLRSSVRYLAFLSFLLSALLYPALGNTEEAKKRERALPQAPDTGTPEEDFSAGGTRDNHLRDNICSVNNQKIVYLLGNRNREFTSSAYPTFWFHIPHGIAPKTNIKFVLEELETGKEIYNQIVPTRGKSTIKGIALPQNEINTLALNTNYIWSLEVSCPQTKEDSLIALSGWLSRLPTNSLLQNQLSITPKQKRYQVYLEHELLYDALSELAQYRIAEPNNKQIETAWNLLLKELGWQDLIQQSNMAKPYVLDTKLLVNNRNN